MSKMKIRIRKRIKSKSKIKISRDWFFLPRKEVSLPRGRQGDPGKRRRSQPAKPD